MTHSTNLPDLGPIAVGPVARNPYPRQSVRPYVRERGTAEDCPANGVRAAYGAHQGELYSFALASTHSVETAEDLVQDAFARLMEATADGKGPANVRAWLYRVLANLVTSRARRRAVAARGLPFLLRSETGEGAEAEFLRGEVDDRIPTALNGLSQLERTALLLAARGTPGRDVASAIGRSEGATRTLMCRARMRLRQRLKTELDA